MRTSVDFGRYGDALRLDRARSLRRIYGLDFSRHLVRSDSVVSFVQHAYRDFETKFIADQRHVSLEAGEPLCLGDGKYNCGRANGRAARRTLRARRGRSGARAAESESSRTTTQLDDADNVDDDAVKAQRQQ